MFGDLIFEGIKEDIGVELSIWRTAPFRVWGDGNTLFTEVAVKVYAKVVWRERLMGALHFMPQLDQTAFEIVVRFSTDLLAGERWQLLPQTTAEFDWHKKPKLGIGLLKVSATKMIQPLIMAEVANIASQVEDYIQQEIALEEKVSHFWAEIQQSMVIHPDPVVGLVINPNPDNLKATPISCRRTGIESNVWVETALEVTVHPGQAAKDSVVMQPFSFAYQLPEEVDSQIISRISFDALNALLSESVYPLGIRQLQAHVLRANGRKEDDKFRLELAVSIQQKNQRIFKANGKVILTFGVRWNADMVRFQVFEMELEVKDKNWLMALALRFQKERIVDRIPMMIDEYLNELDQEIKEKVVRDLHDFPFAEIPAIAGQCY